MNLSTSAVATAAQRFSERGQSPNNVAVHVAALQQYVNELRDALALALALNRTLVLPRWTCFCDRMWAASDDLFAFGCMYPGSQAGQFLPFACPMDHVLSPRAWHLAKVAYRPAAFLRTGSALRGGVGR